MIKYTLTVITFLFCLHGSAQTITSAYDFNPGDVRKTVQLSPTLNPGPQGAMQVWDFSKVGLYYPKDTITYTYAATAGSPFPGAAVVEKSSEGLNYYLDKTANGIYISGYNNYTFPSGYIECVYNPNDFHMPKTLYMLATASDTQAFKSTAGNYWESRGTSSFKVDGSGQLILPGGITYNNVLRVKELEPVIDTGTFGRGKNVRTRFYWFDEYHKSPLLFKDSVATYDLNYPTPPPPTIYQRVEMMVYENAVGINNIVNNQPHYSASFIDNQLLINGTFNTGETYHLRLYNTAGQIVYQTDFIPNGNQQKIDTGNDLPKGLYLLMMDDKSGTRNAIKIAR